MRTSRRPRSSSARWDVCPGSTFCVPGGAEEEEALSRIREILPPEAEILPAGARGSALEQMTRAFSLNLSALSLLALVVGTFLVYNTMTFSVLQRRQLVGTLRALGVTRGEVFAQVLSEAAVLGAAGTILGLPLGYLLGKFLLGMVTRSIGDLYFALSVREVSVTTATLLKAVGLGTLGAVAASLGPAYEATSTPPRDVMRRSAIETGVRKILPAISAAGAGLILLGAGSAALSLPEHPPVLRRTVLHRGGVRAPRAGRDHAPGPGDPAGPGRRRSARRERWRPGASRHRSAARGWRPPPSWSPCPPRSGSGS